MNWRLFLEGKTKISAHDPCIILYYMHHLITWENDVLRDVCETSKPYKKTSQRRTSPLSDNSEVKPMRLDDDTERDSWSIIKTLNYASYAQLFTCREMRKYIIFKYHSGEIWSIKAGQWKLMRVNIITYK